MKLFGRELSDDLVIVAEVGVNHEGDVEKASELLRLAHEAGADAVKFQSYTPNRFASANDPARLERVARFGLSEADHRRLASEAEALGAHFFSTAVTEDWVPLIAELSSAIKIASGDLTFEPVIRAAAGTGKPMIVSTGAGSEEEIDQAVSWVAAEVGEDKLRERLILLHCVACYPTPLQEASLRTIAYLRDRYPVHVGYSNHVIGPEACLAAVALGASILEVHFTDRKTGREFRDHELSFEPADLQALVTDARALMLGLGREGRARSASEQEVVDILRKGVVAARDLESGRILERGDLMYARPAVECRADEIDQLVGCALEQSLRQGELIPRATLRAG